MAKKFNIEDEIKIILMLIQDSKRTDDVELYGHICEVIKEWHCSEVCYLKNSGIGVFKAKMNFTFLVPKGEKIATEVMVFFMETVNIAHKVGFKEREINEETDFYMCHKPKGDFTIVEFDLSEGFEDENRIYIPK